MRLEEGHHGSNDNNEKHHINESVSQFVLYLLRLWWLFIIVGVLSGLAGIFYAANQKIKYQSRLTFALDNGNQGSVGGFLSLASQFGVNIGGDKDIFAGDNIIDIMKSRRMIEDVLLSVDTFDNKPYTLVEYFLTETNRQRKDPKVKGTSFPPGIDKSKFTYQQDSVLYAVYLEFANNYLKADRPDKKLSIYEVNVISPDEKFTKDFTDRIVNETNKFYTEIRTKKAKETLTILEQRTSEMKGNLNSSIAGKAQVQDVNVNPTFAAALVPAIKQQENIQVYGAAYGEMFKNLELARFQYLNEIPLLQIIDPADFPMEKIKSSKLKTGIIFSAAACILLILIFWVARVIKLFRLKALE